MTFVRVLAALSLVTLLACERPVPPSMRDKVAADTKKADAAKPAPKAEAPKAAEPAPAPKAEEPAPAEAPKKVEVSEEAMKAAQAKFDTICATCHGANGKGDGAVGAALNPKPRDYTDAKWQESVTDEYLAKAILEGGVAVGKSPLMPGNPDLKDKPDVVQGLVNIVRGFKGK